MEREMREEKWGATQSARSRTSTLERIMEVGRRVRLESSSPAGPRAGGGSTRRRGAAASSLRRSSSSDALLASCSARSLRWQSARTTERKMR